MFFLGPGCICFTRVGVLYRDEEVESSVSTLTCTVLGGCLFESPAMGEMCELERFGIENDLGNNRLSPIQFDIFNDVYRRRVEVRMSASKRFNLRQRGAKREKKRGLKGELKRKKLQSYRRTDNEK